MKKAIAVVTALAFFAISNTAHAAYIDNNGGYPVEVLSLDLTFPDNYTVTGYMGIGLGAPSIPPYVAFQGDLPLVEKNGIPLQPGFSLYAEKSWWSLYVWIHAYLSVFD